VAVDFCAELPRPILPIMTYETSPFAFRVEADPQRQDRYLWAIGYGPQTYRRSPQSFATRREAKNDALKLCRRWRHIGGASVTRRLRRDGREAEKGRRMTPAQCRAARALIGWSQEELSAASKVEKATIANFELGKRAPYARTLDDLRAALERGASSSQSRGC
jgi:DNA-binding transcriptional regulator YiaG